MPRLLFVKEGPAIWSSHLDLMRALMRSFRRAGIDLKHSQGFTPHPELSILMPLSVGVESQCEIADFALAEGCSIPAEEIAPRLAPVLPAGLRALASYEGGQKAGKLAWLRARLTLTYEASGIRHTFVTLRVQASGAGGTDSSTPLRSAQNDKIEALSALFARPSIVVEKHGKKGVVETDVAPMIRELSIGCDHAPRSRDASAFSATSPVGCCGRSRTAMPEATSRAFWRLRTALPQAETDKIVIEAVVAAQNPTLNPLLLATAIETYLPQCKPDLVQCRRLEIYDQEMNVFR